MSAKLTRRLDALEDAAFWAHRILADAAGVPFSPAWANGIEDRIAELLARGVGDRAIAARLADDLGIGVGALLVACARVRGVRRAAAR